MDVMTEQIDHVDIGDTRLAARIRGCGPTLLLVHGAGEDLGLLDGQAEAFAAAGFEVITYDRRGTGGSGRASWPGGGADQHADDAAALLRALGRERATVLGFSSGAVVALRLAALHPGAVAHVVAWEPPAAGALPGGAEMTAQVMAPVRAHLAEHPGDLVGAQAVLLGVLAGAPVAADDPAFAPFRPNAEAMVLDDPDITLAPFTDEDLRNRPVTLVVGPDPNPIIAGGVARLAELAGVEPVVVDAEHEIYLQDPAVLARALDGLLARWEGPERLRP